jgi:hypothetical protein
MTTMKTRFPMGICVQCQGVCRVPVFYDPQGQLHTTQYFDQTECDRARDRYRIYSDGTE